MVAKVVLADFLNKAIDSGVDLSAFFIQGGVYKYKFQGVSGNNVSVGYGGDFTTKGTLINGMYVSHLSFERLGRQLNLGKPVIIVHCPTIE